MRVSLRVAGGVIGGLAALAARDLVQRKHSVLGPSGCGGSGPGPRIRRDDVGPLLAVSGRCSRRQ